MKPTPWKTENRGNLNLVFSNGEIALAFAATPALGTYHGCFNLSKVKGFIKRLGMPLFVDGEHNGSINDANNS